MATGRRVSFDLPIDAVGRLAVADPRIMTTRLRMITDLRIVITRRRMITDLRIVTTRRRMIADLRIMTTLRRMFVADYRIVAGLPPVGEFRIVAGHRPVGEFRIVDLAGGRQVGESRIMAMLRQMAELAVMAQDRQVRTDPRVMALWLTMNTQLSIVAQGHWMSAELRLMLLTTHVSVMGHRPGMRTRPFVTELRIVRSMPVMAV